MKLKSEITIHREYSNNEVPPWPSDICDHLNLRINNEGFNSLIKRGNKIKVYHTGLEAMLTFRTKKSKSVLSGVISIGDFKGEYLPVTEEKAWYLVKILLEYELPSKD
nr:hypothetical protein [Nanoarchaeota archaeon]